MTVWLKLSEKDLQLSAVFVVTVFFQGKRSRRDLKFFTREEGAKVKWAVGKCGIASGGGMSFVHKRCHDETTITDFGRPPFMTEAILGVSASISSKSSHTQICGLAS